MDEAHSKLDGSPSNDDEGKPVACPYPSKHDIARKLADSDIVIIQNTYHNDEASQKNIRDKIEAGRQAVTSTNVKPL